MDHDPVADIPAGYARAGLDDFAGDLVAQRGVIGCGEGMVADVAVGPADTGREDAQQYLTAPGDRPGNILDCDNALAF